MNGEKSRALRKELGFKSKKKTEYKTHKNGQRISSKGHYRKIKKQEATNV